MAAVGNCLRLLQASRAWYSYRPSSPFGLNSLVKVSCRQLLDRRIIALDKFEYGAQIRKEKFGKRAEDFKVNLLESLDDPEVELLDQDCLSFIYLMNSDDLPYLLKVIHRHQSQVAREEDSSMNMDNIRLAGHALRICHLLGSADTALEVFKIYEPDTKDVVPSIAVLMDLLYDSKRYEECTDIAVKYLIDKHDLHRKQLQPLLTIALISALHMESEKGLRACSQLSNAWSKMGGANVKYAQWLLVLYCIKQGRINVALNKLSQITPESFSDVVLVSNLKALISVKSKNELSAFNLILQLHADVKKQKTNVTDKQILFHDVFLTLSPLASRANHVEFISSIRKTTSTTVYSNSLSAFLTQRLLRHYTRSAVTSKIVPIFDELVDDGAFSHYLDTFNTAEQVLEPTETPNIGTNTTNSKHLPDDAKKSTKTLTMVIENGYIKFVEK